MVDFKKLRESKAKPRPINPRDIFNSLPKPPGINDLYASQAEVLDVWFSRRIDADMAVKLHTGGGKTLVALLIAQSVMNETNAPVLYLAPTTQLVEQVINKSREYGISTVPYPKGNGTPLPPEFYDGESVLVCTYEALFNGRSKFGVRGQGRPVKVGAMILDDAHVALSSVRDAFSLVIPSEKYRDIYDDLAGRFRFAMKEVGRTGSFADIVRGKDFGTIEVPSWAWQQKIPEVQDYLSRCVEEINPFIWPFLRDHLEVCHCLFSRNSVTITPIFPLVDMLPTFEESPRRIYMSATIADDSEIIRTFNASLEAIKNPITSTSLAGIGERMILVPELMKLGDVAITPMVKEIVASISAHRAGTAVLTPSGNKAREWTDVAKYPCTTQDVSSLVRAMQEGNFFGPIVLANRYDGIDLAGNACRLLVMDELPQGTTDYDMFRVNVIADSAVNSLLAQRIEQGIGRGTRGAGDYCVILLIGSKLVGWVGRKNNLSHLTASTRVQLKMGQEVSEEVTTIQEIEQTILKCLNRDPDWVAYHASELSEAAHTKVIDEVSLRIAGAERRAFKLQRIGQYEQAIQILEEIISDRALISDPQRRAWLSALASRIAFQKGDEQLSQRFQTSAFSINNNHTPPKIRPRYVARPLPSSQAISIVNKLLEYDRRAAVLPDFDEAVSSLVPEASSGQFEESLAQLGSYLGFESERPDNVYKTGPDVLWRTDALFDFVIEAKSKKEDDNPLYKKEHAQLLEAEQWVKATYPGRETLRVSALPEAFADEKATPIGSYALKLNEIAKIVGCFRSLLVELSGSSDDPTQLQELCEAGLRKHQLTPTGIKTFFLKPFGKWKAAK